MKIINHKTKILKFINLIDKHIPPMNSHEYSGYFDGKTIHIFKGSKSKANFVDGWFLFHTHPTNDNYGISFSDIIVFFLSSSKYLYFKNKKSKMLLIKNKVKKKLLKEVKLKILLESNYSIHRNNQDEFLKSLYKNVLNNNIISWFDYFGICGYNIYENKIKQYET